MKANFHYHCHYMYLVEKEREREREREREFVMEGMKTLFVSIPKRKILLLQERQ